MSQKPRQWLAWTLLADLQVNALKKQEGNALTKEKPKYLTWINSPQDQSKFSIFFSVCTETSQLLHLFSHSQSLIESSAFDLSKLQFSEEENMGCSSQACSSSYWQIILLQAFLWNLGSGLSMVNTLASPSSSKFVSAIGDPGMKSPNVRVALEAWNFCNEVGFEAPNMGSPRLADCADLSCPPSSGIPFFHMFYYWWWTYLSIHQLLLNNW